jgi:hypothetical protein
MKLVNKFFVLIIIPVILLPAISAAETIRWTAGGNSHGIISVFTASGNKEIYSPGETVTITANANSEDQSFGANTRGLNAISDFLFGSGGGTNRQGVSMYIYDFNRQFVASCGNGMVETYVMQGDGDSSTSVLTSVPEFTTNCTAVASIVAPTTPGIYTVYFAGCGGECTYSSLSFAVKVSPTVNKTTCPSGQTGIPPNCEGIVMVSVFPNSQTVNSPATFDINFTTRANTECRLLDYAGSVMAGDNNSNWRNISGVSGSFMESYTGSASLSYNIQCRSRTLNSNSGTDTANIEVIAPSVCSAGQTGIPPNCVNKPVPINGICGSSNNQVLVTKPTTNLCNQGTATTVAGEGPWIWDCVGQYGGNDASCESGKAADITDNSFKATPTAIFPRRSVTLSWEITGVGTCTLTGVHVSGGNVVYSNNSIQTGPGSVVFSNLDKSTRFTLICPTGGESLTVTVRTPAVQEF